MQSMSEYYDWCDACQKSKDSERQGNDSQDDDRKD